MIDTRIVATVALGLVLHGQAARGENHSGYREFELGSTLRSVSALTGVAPTEAKTIHSRPAVIQLLEWRLPYFLNGSSGSEPVRQIAFTFYNDQLSKMVVDYHHDRTNGMTDVDLIDAISAAYGPSTKPAPKKTATFITRIEDESGTPLARWGDAEAAVVLYRSSFAAGFRLVVSSPRLEALARTADDEARKLDAREAPQREIARQKQELEDTRVSQEKARAQNKASFRP